MSVTLNPQGKTVLQVITTGSTTTGVTTTSSTPVSLGLTASITPSFAGSTILIYGIVNCQWGTNSGYGYALVNLFKNSTSMGNSFSIPMFQSINPNMDYTYNNQLLFQDTSSNTASTTYSFYGSLPSSSNYYAGVYFNLQASYTGYPGGYIQLVELG